MTDDIRRQIAIAIGRHFRDPKAKPNDDGLAALFDGAAAAVLDVVYADRDVVIARIVRLESALKPFANLAGALVDDGATTAIGLTEAHFVEARAALKS